MICLISSSLLATTTSALAAGDNKAHVVLAQDIDPKVTAIVERYRASIPKMMAEQKAPGLAIALLFGGELVWAEGFGVTDTTSNRPVTPETTSVSSPSQRPIPPRR
ncbi:MAG: serine hydrolase [Gammaproteobacteria bacterium]|nr:serine hydrolase [Gammaproteobacteria bacterium]